MAEFSFLDIDATMEPMNHFAELNPNSMENPHLNFHSLMMGGFSADNFFMQQQQQLLEFPANLGVNFPGIFHLDDDKSAFQVSEAPMDVSEGNESKKRKSIDLPESSSGNSSPPVSEDVFIPRKNNSRRGKKIKGNDKGEEKPKEVVHVRARRGQATDSHSLAERVRRGKINEKLRCLQGIVPGCYKTMGMAVMLDEIINYVQSLQNQVEFLSMKLTAASRYYDFNLDTDAVETLQRAKAYEVQSLSGEGFHQGLNSSISTQHHASFDLSFGSYPSLPYNS